VKVFLSFRRLLIITAVLIPLYFVGYKVFFFYLEPSGNKVRYHINVLKQINRNQQFLLKMPVLFGKKYILRKLQEIERLTLYYEKSVIYVTTLDFNSTSNVETHNYIVGLAKIYPAIFARQALVFTYITLPWTLMFSILIILVLLYQKLKVIFVKEKKEKLQLIPSYKPEIYVHRDGNKIGKSLTPVSEIFFRIYSNYHEMPASLDNHQSYPGGLLDHIKGINEFLHNSLEDLKSEFPHIPEHLIVDSCAGHDIGKTLTYYKNGETWMSYAAYHDKLGGIIVNALKEEILTYYSPEEYTGLYYSISYHHKPKDVPIDAPVYVQDLINIINRADYYAANQHAKKAQEIVLKNKSVFVQSFLEINPQLNINGWKKGLPDGFYFPPEGEKPGAVILFWGNIRNKLVDKLPEEIKIYFKYKKAVYSILPVFYNEMKNIFMLEFEGHKVSSSGTFSIMGRTDVVVMNEIFFPQEIKKYWLMGRQLKRDVISRKQKSETDNKAPDKEAEIKETETSSNINSL